MWINLVSLFIIGLFFGSFYNCIANRLSKNESIINPGSHCENCNKKLTWYELIPVFSYIIQRGKCNKCKIKLPIEYLLSELFTGLLFALSYFRFGMSYDTLISIILSSLVIIICITDFKYMIILDEVLVPAFVLIVVLLFLEHGITFVLWSLLKGLCLFIFLLVIKLFGDKAFEQESLGWGDVKLSFLAGTLLGVKLGLVYLFVGALIALPYGIITRVCKKDLLMPFGPFLITSLYIIFLFHSVMNIVLNVLIGG